MLPADDFTRRAALTGGERNSSIQLTAWLTVLHFSCGWAVLLAAAASSLIPLEK